MDFSVCARLSAGALTVALLGAPAPAFAHHSYAMFNRLKKVTIEGTIAKFDWRNPHIYIWLYVKNAKGGDDLYAVEGGSVTMLARQGWSANIIRPGDKVKIDMNPLKDGRNGGYFVQLVKADGTVIRGDAAAGQGNGHLPGSAGAAAAAVARDKTESNGQ